MYLTKNVQKSKKGSKSVAKIKPLNLKGVKNDDKMFDDYKEEWNADYD